MRRRSASKEPRVSFHPPEVRLKADTTYAASGFSRTLSRQSEREKFAAVIPAADGDDDVLLAVVHVGHRRSALGRRHVDGAEFRAVGLAVGAEHRATRTRRRREETALARNDKRFRHQRG